MKRILRLSSSLILLAILLQSCIQKETSLPQIIIGEWKVYNYEVEKESENKVKVLKARTLALSTNYAFHEDFGYSISSKAIPNGRDGNWSWNPATSKLKLTIDGDSHEIDVVKYDENIIVFRNFGPSLGEIKTYLRKEKR